MNSYLITVVTSDLPFAGTDANVFIELNGSRGSTGRVPLKNSKSNKNPFEQGKKDLFEIQCKDLGTIRSIKIGHDDKGISSGWHLNQVQIESKLDGRIWVCECNRWFDKKEGDHKIERELMAKDFFLVQKKPVNYDQDAIYKKVVKYEPDYRPEERYTNKKLYYQPDDTIYKITVVTSDVKNAGTDADVFIQIIGKQGETRKILLEKSKTNRNKFEAGRTDEFEVSDIDVGKIRKIIIGHNNKGISPNWHLKEVIIEKSGNKYVFPCGKWFDKKSEDGLIERELKPIEEIVDKSDRAHNFIGRDVHYDINVVTSDVFGAGTDADVFIKIYGEYTKSDYIELKKSLTHNNKFERANTDKFSFKQEFYGEIQKIKIKQDLKKSNPDWHLKEVVIESPDLGRRWVFPYNEWVSKNSQGLFEVVLEPLKNKDILTDSNMKTYVIEVYTGDWPNSGTDANVYLTMFSEDQESREFHLNESETHLNKFEKNHMDRFKVETNDLGRLIGIRVRHDNSGIYPSWYLDRVVIRDKNDIYEFVCNKWLSDHRDDFKIERIIMEKNYKKPSQRPKTRPRPKSTKGSKTPKPKPIKINYYDILNYYYVKVYTGDKQSIAGTDLHASITLFGDNCVSQPFKLSETKTHEKQFYGNQIDLFELETLEDLGILYAIEVKFCDCLSKANDLDLRKIEIVHNEETFTFYCDQVISVRDPNEVKYVKKIIPENNAQFF